MTLPLDRLIGSLARTGMTRFFQRLFADYPDLSAWLWGVGTAIILASLVTEIGISLGRGEFGLDLIAALAMSGALFLGEYFAGIIIAMMFADLEAPDPARAQAEFAKWKGIANDLGKPGRDDIYGEGELGDERLDISPLIQGR